MKMKKLVLAVVLFVSTLSVMAQKSPVFETDGVAVRGYDVVAYFTESKPVKGTPKFTYSWKGVNWNFASAKNRDAFKANPEKYAPQYGGYCAYGTSQGHKAPTQPDAWTIVNDKLYLNYNNDVKATWNKDQKGYIEKANENWPKIRDKE